MAIGKPALKTDAVLATAIYRNVRSWELFLGTEFVR